MKISQSIHQLTREIMTPEACVFVEGTGNYTLLVAKGQVVVYARTMKRVCDQYSFLTRIHKKYAVNLAHVDHVRYDKTTGRATVVTKNGNSLDISRRCYRQLGDQLQPLLRPFNS